MHQKFAKEGLAVITVALDDKKDDPDAEQNINKFIKAKGATFTNLWLDEPQAFWQQKLDFVGAPAYFVFDRKGRWTRFRSDDGDINYDELDKHVIELLREK